MAFGILAALGWGVADFVAAAVSKRIGVLWTTLGVHVGSVVVASFYLVLSGGFPDISFVQLGLLVGLAFVALITYLMFYRALQIGPLAVVSPIVSAYAMVVILMAAAFSGERLSVLQMIGVSASISGIVLSSIDFSQAKSSANWMNAGVLLAFGVMLGLGAWQYALGSLTRELGWFVPIYVSRLLTLVLLVPIVSLKAGHLWKRINLSSVVIVSIAGVVEIGGLFSFARGAEIGIISIVAASSTIYPIVPIVGGIAVFKERLGKSQILGLAIALSGLLALALSS